MSVASEQTTEANFRLGVGASHPCANIKAQRWARRVCAYSEGGDEPTMGSEGRQLGNGVPANASDPDVGPVEGDSDRAI
jgi:hypothetical protein